METLTDNNSGRGSKSLTRRILLWIDWIVIGLLGLIVVGISLLTWLLTPERLTRIINNEASKELEADVRASNVRFTLWSTFPHLYIQADSLSVRSRTLDSISPSLRKELPPDADFLVSTGKLRGGINIVKLLNKDIRLRDVDVDSLRLNLLAVNDTLNNYDIVPGSGKSSIPRFNIDGMRLADTGHISYRSLESDTHAELALKGATLMPADSTNSYRLRLNGDVSAASGGLTLVTNFPIELDGNVHVRFKPFGISTNDYRVQLGEVNGNISMDMQIGESMQLNNFNYRLRGFTVNDLLEMLPAGNYPMLRRLNANLPVNATARLTSPYSFTSGRLPSAEVRFNVGSGKLSYTLSDGRKYEADHVGLNGNFFFNGLNPAASYVDIPSLHADAEGMDLDMAARITNLTGNPRVAVNMRGRTDLDRLSRFVAELRPYGLSGVVGVDAGLQFDLNNGTLYGSLLDVNLNSDRLNFKYGPYRVGVKGLKASTSESYAQALTSERLLHDIPLDLKIRMDGVTFDDPKDSVHVSTMTASVDGRLSRAGRGSVLRTAGLHFRSSGAFMRAGATRVNVGPFDITLSGSKLTHPVIAPDFKTPAQWNADARTLAFASHTPEFITVNIPDRLRSIMANWKTYLNLKIKRAEIRNGGYPAENRINDIDLSASFDSLTLRRATFSSGDTRGTIRLHAGNVRQFLTSRTPAPIRLDLDLDLDTVQINQLARAYTDGHPHSAIARGDKEEMARGIDTVALMLPRNIVANVHATAMQTRYINLHLYNLMTDLRLADGRLDVDTLHIGADFGEAALKYTFDTSDLQNISMDAQASVYDVDVVRFFQNFHKLLLMMPQMKNLSGNLSADINAHVNIFPNMYLTVPSLRADAHVDGHDLVLKQDDFIHHITERLLIRGNEPLHIANVAVHAGVHNNLLEVFPFKFEVSNYRLTLCGINNFDGDIYYHIGVDKWPLHIPFGLNIKGKFHHPKIHFGGKDWKDSNGAQITSTVEDYTTYNIMREMRKMGGEFIHTAASYRGN